jgi:hypothetical protein
MVSWAASKVIQDGSAPCGSISGISDTISIRRRQPNRYIIAFWHENMLLPAYHFAMP